MRKVNSRGCKKNVDYWLISITDGFPGGINVACAGTGKSGDSNSMAFSTLCNLFDCLEVPRRGSRKTSLNNVDIETYKLLSNLYLLFNGHRSAW